MIAPKHEPAKYTVSDLSGNPNFPNNGHSGRRFGHSSSPEIKIYEPEDAVSMVTKKKKKEKPVFRQINCSTVNNKNTSANPNLSMNASQVMAFNPHSHVEDPVKENGMTPLVYSNTGLQQSTIMNKSQGVGT